ncbi:hypothetical protein JAAARDRAFT_188179 [Jaapia argillacea MUCL 33604]|uniref:Uncharacterized protein n=1 Tax=Jaapia argillacea MUCL 33604 TaxID=933084 RepID=A0A067QD64_9AGAM|nr:hypothetical protein JAAARDRAFT_188179 [Jaapia argillacea MUCL 33604]
MSKSPIHIARALQQLLPKPLPRVLSNKPSTLYDVLSRAPLNPAGKRVHQIRWGEKGIEDSYWEVTKANFKGDGGHGRAWGILYWKGQRISERPERIRGALKYYWQFGRSKTPIVVPTPVTPAKRPRKRSDSSKPRVPS